MTGRYRARMTGIVHEDDSDLSPWEAMVRATRGEVLGHAAQAHLRPDGVLGALSQMPLTEILQTLDFGKKSARVDVYFATRRGTVHVHEGQIVRAELVTLEADFHEGEAAVIELCRDPEGFFRIAYGRFSVDRNVQRPTTFVLLEALRILDEAVAARDGDAGMSGDDAEVADDADSWGPMAAARSEPGRTVQAIPASPFDEDEGDGVDVDFDVPTGSIAMPALPRVQALVNESEFLVAAGDLNGAQQLLLEAHQLAPNDDDVRRRLRHVDEAIDAAKAHAFLEQAMKGSARAVELARRATELRPVRDVLLRALAVFARHKAWEEVADTAEQLLDIDDDDEGALRTLLDARVAMKRWSGAHDVVKKLLRSSPGDARLRGIEAEIAAHLKR
jgi:tetratricopeptide (TPR) repeat protein